MNLCRRGHDKDVVGVALGNRCQQCRLLSRAPDGFSLSRQWLPAQPLVAGAPEAVHQYLPDNLQRAYWRAKNEGRITVAMADEISVAFGYHPSQLWGDAWWIE